MKVADFREEVDRELAAWPGVTYRREPTASHCNSHYRMVMSYEGRSVRRPEPSSPGGGRGLLNYISEMRRQLRSIGAERLSRKGGKTCDAHP